MILIDSDVLIWLTRGHPGAMTRLMQIKPWRISTITYLEIAQGCRSKDELQRAKLGLAAQENPDTAPNTADLGTGNGADRCTCTWRWAATS